MWYRKAIRKSQVVSSWLIFVPIQPATVLGTGVEPTLQQVRIEELSKPILAFDIAKGSDLAAVALADLRVRVWKLSSGKVLPEFPFTEPATNQHLKLENEVEPISLHFSPDGKTLAVGFVNAIHLYDVETWTEQVVLAVPGEDETRPGITATHQGPELTPRTAEQARIQSEEPVLDMNQTMRKWATQRHQGDGRTRISDFAFAGGDQLLLASYCRGPCWVWPGIRRDQFLSGKDPVRLWNMRQAESAPDRPIHTTDHTVPSRVSK
jgi:WD40 repeat protein